jgi:hypothetical protein
VYSKSIRDGGDIWLTLIEKGSDLHGLRKDYTSLLIDELIIENMG